MFIRNVILGGVVACLATTSVQGGKGGIPPGAIPWQQPQCWPYPLGSEHFVVHSQTQAAGEKVVAQKVAEYLERAWSHYVGEMGFPEPLSDHGVALPDDRMDIYLWTGMGGFYVDAIAPNEATGYDDWSTFIALDPASSYAATDAELEANLYHELRHSIQAVDDWWEHIFAFEADTTMLEARRFGYKRLAYVWADYQAHPDWGLFRDDGFRTWYMYGGALFFEFLSQTRFDGKVDFLLQMWEGSRNPPGAGLNPILNEPDFCDALDQILRPGTSLEQQILAFARARWYAGARYDHRFFPLPAEGPEAVPAVASLTHERRKDARETKVTVSPMMLGTSYITVKQSPTDGGRLAFALQGASAVRYIVQVVGRGHSDYTIRNFQELVAFQDGEFTLAVTVLPLDNVSTGFDPDTQTDTRYRTTLVFGSSSNSRPD